MTWRPRSNWRAGDGCREGISNRLLASEGSSHTLLLSRDGSHRCCILAYCEEQGIEGPVCLSLVISTTLVSHWHAPGLVPWAISSCLCRQGRSTLCPGWGSSRSGCLAHLPSLNTCGRLAVCTCRSCS